MAGMQTGCPERESGETSSGGMVKVRNEPLLAVTGDNSKSVVVFECQVRIQKHEKLVNDAR